jgi:NitT/TauT family transport system ATP-binding protein
LIDRYTGAGRPCIQCAAAVDQLPREGILNQRTEHASAVAVGNAAGPGAVSGSFTADNVGITYHSAKGAAVEAIRSISFTVAPMEFVAIVGPSGCGKSTLLRAISGLQPITSGALRLGDKPVTRPGNDRAMVFQQPSLLPWRTVEDNIGYGLQLQGKLDKRELHERAVRLADLVGLKGFEQAYPAALSGGMQQRANLARALALEPQLLLLDEPFASIDAQTREYMQTELVRIWEQTKNTVLLVTHDIREAVYLADRVVVLSGRPSRVRCEIPIDFARPRALEIRRTSAFGALEQQVWDALSAG